MNQPRPAEPSDDDSDAYSTLDFIQEARRPVLIERHRGLIEEMESGLSDALVTGTTDHPRLKAMLRELEAESEQKRITNTLAELSSPEHHRGQTFRAALVEELCLLREQAGIEMATLQLHAIGVYRRVRELVGQHQDEMPGLEELRELPGALLGRIINPVVPAFGTPVLAEALVVTPAFADRCLRTIHRLHRPDNADSHWQDAAGDPTLSREEEEPLQALSEAERRETRQLLVRSHIRRQFFKDVFTKYLHPDEYDHKETDTHRTVLQWLKVVEGTAHLYPFMQGQTSGQKAFRLARLLEKIVQLHEIYARVALASQHPSYRERFKDLDTRARLKILGQERYPALAMGHELMLAALLCPFTSFVAFVQDRVSAKDFVLPPDPKRG